MQDKFLAQRLDNWRKIISRSRCEGALAQSDALWVVAFLREKALPEHTKLISHVVDGSAVLCCRFYGKGSAKNKTIGFQYKNRFVPITLTKLRANSSSTNILSNRQLALGAMRFMISPQIKAWRANREMTLHCNYTCPLSCKDLRKIARSKRHVDHIGKPFSQIVDEFCLQYNINLNTVSCTARSFRNKVLAAQWIAFHFTHAKYQLVDGSANCGKGAGGYKSKF